MFVDTGGDLTTVGFCKQRCAVICHVINTQCVAEAHRPTTFTGYCLIIATVV